MNDVFKALADPTRREILLMIAQKPESVNTIAERFKMSRPAVSKHIKILESSNLARVEADHADGRQRNCFAQLEALSEVNQYIAELTSFWTAKLNSLESFLQKKHTNKGNQDEA